VGDLHENGLASFPEEPHGHRNMDGAASFSCGKDEYRGRGDGAAAPVLPMNRRGLRGRQDGRRTHAPVRLHAGLSLSGMPRLFQRAGRPYIVLAFPPVIFWETNRTMMIKATCNTPYAHAVPNLKAYIFCQMATERGIVWTL